MVKKNLNPEWNFEIECEVRAPQNAEVELKIWDKDLATSDAMGAVILRDLPRGDEVVEEWHDVECTTDCKDASGRLCVAPRGRKPERKPPSSTKRRHLEVLVLKDNPDLGIEDARRSRRPRRPHRRCLAWIWRGAAAGRRRASL